MGRGKGRTLDKTIKGSRKWKEWRALGGEGFGEFIFLHNSKPL
jgi:hypothetical protein